VPVGSELWPSEMHEPLLMFVCLPFIPHSPWRLSNTPKLLGMERQLHRVWQEPAGDPRFVLRELLEFTRRLPSLPPKLVRSMLYSIAGGQVPCGREKR
jgi:hypothetical protein